jgi:hypothetical protein
MRKLMTPEQKLDRLEHLVRLLYEAILRDSREARKQTAKWKAYFAADREHESAKAGGSRKAGGPEHERNSPPGY